MVLACIPSYRVGAVLNMLASGLTFMAGVSLLAVDRYRSDILIVDDFNIYLVTLTTFVAFTSSIFSASYIGHELETGRLTPTFLRFYHALYQAMIGAMNVALVANKRRPALGRGRGGDALDRDDGRHLSHAGGGRGGVEVLYSRSVGIALAFFGTILVYLVARTYWARDSRRWPGI